MKKIGLHIIFYLFCTAIQAQFNDLTMDYSLVKKAVQDAMPVQINSNYTFYTTHTSSNAVSTAKSTTKLDSNLYNQEIEGVFTIIDKHDVLIADNNEKILMLDHFEGNIIDVLWAFDLDQLSEFIVDVKKEIIENYTTYDLSIQYATVERVIFTFHSDTYHLHEMTMYYAYEDSYGDNIAETSKARMLVEIDDYISGFKNFHTLNNNPYIYKKNMDYKAKTKYQSFNFINNMESK